jgi:bla regulator protein blaR1
MTHALTAWFLETMVATTLLMAAILLLRGPVARFFGPRAAYLLWAAPALRMILPPLPSDWLSPASTGVQNVAVVLAGTSSLTRQATVAAEGSAAWPLVLAILWLGGAALFFAQHLLSYARFTRAVRERATPMFEQGRIKVASSEYVASPIAFGVFGKSIIVPIDFTHRFDATEQRLALSHETIHHHRGDLIVNLAALAILALHWFNPLAHFAHRAFRLDQEAACDALVLAKSDANERRAYGTALYKSATGGVPLAICATATAATLKKRLRGIAVQRATGWPLRLGMPVAIAFVLIAQGLTVSGGIAAPALDNARARSNSPVEGEQSIVTPVTAGGRAIATAPTDAVRSALAAADQADAQADAAREAADNARDQASEARDAALDQAQAATEAAAAKAEQAQQAASEAHARATQAVAAAADSRSGVTVSPAECQSARSRQVSASNVNGDVVVIVICDGKVKTFTNAASPAALRQAREQIGGMDLSSADRATALKSLEAFELDGQSGQANKLVPLQ